jgi:hypothetical protein
LYIIETICSDEALHKQRIEARSRNIEGMQEISWSRVLERKDEYESWTDEHLTLDSTGNEEELVTIALHYIERK